MASFSNSRKDDKSGKEVANVADEQSGHSTTVDIPSEITTIRRLHRVPPQVRANKEHIYAPFVLPLGPYHHDEVRFDQAEQLKNEVLDIKLPDKNDQDFARGEFLKRAQEIRNFYGGLKGYNDNTLAEMMLRDVCFVVYYMEVMIDQTGEQISHLMLRLGLSGLVFMNRDFVLLENQVPLWAIKLLTRLTLFKGDGDDNHVEEFLWKAVTYGNKMLSDDEFSDPIVVGGVPPWRDGNGPEPLHLLELIRRADIKSRRSNGTNGSRNGASRKIFEKLKWKSSSDDKTGSTRIPNHIPSHPARSVVGLKAKGIQVCPSSTCLTDIRFESYWFFGKLLLPIYFIDDTTKVYFSNVIAFEMSPVTLTKAEFISYVNFMQSLIESPIDVKELRENGVLKSFMNDEQVMNTFKELDLYGTNNFHIFNDVKMKIDWHCRSKEKTWMTDLRYKYFDNPWSVIALFTAAVVLCLTFLQTIYSMK